MVNDYKDFINNLAKRNISGVFCGDISSAVGHILNIITPQETIGISGSVSLDEIGIIDKLEARGNKVFNQYRKGLSREDSLVLRRSGSIADCYLASANAVSLNGELVFLSAYGERIAGISSAKKLIVVCGINKLTADLGAALKRAREYATPLNCRRLNWNSACLSSGICRQDICFKPEYKRMCCQTLVIEGEISPGRLKFILVGEKLGF